MKKFGTALLTLSFLLSVTGGALANNTATTTITPTTNPTQAVTTLTTDIIDVNSITGKLSAVDLINKKLTINASATSTRTFIYDTRTIFEYNAQTITVDKIPLGSKLTVKYLTQADNTERVIKVQVIDMLQYQYTGFVSILDFTNKKITVNKSATEKYAFSYDATTVFDYKGLAITPENIPLESKVVVQYILLADNTVKVTKFQVISIKEERLEGGLTVVDYTNKKITIKNSKDVAKTLTYDDKTIFEYKGLSIKPEQLVIGSKVVATYNTIATGDKLIKVQIVDLTPKQTTKPNKKECDDKKKDPKKKNNNAKAKGHEKAKGNGHEKSQGKGHDRD